MARDIEEFLKRAAERRRQQQQPAPQQQPPAQRQPPPRQPQPVRKQPQPLIIDDVHVVDDPYAGETVAEHVEQHLNTEDISEHATNLGEEVANRDDKVDERIHQKFDHQVGHLNLDSRPSIQDSTTAVTETAVNADATALFEMMMQPKTVAQAILISEILKRPDF